MFLLTAVNSFGKETSMSEEGRGAKNKTLTLTRLHLDVNPVLAPLISVS